MVCALDTMEYHNRGACTRLHALSSTETSACCHRFGTFPFGGMAFSSNPYYVRAACWRVKKQEGISRGSIRSSHWRCRLHWLHPSAVASRSRACCTVLDRFYLGEKAWQSCQPLRQALVLRRADIRRLNKNDFEGFDAVVDLAGYRMTVV